MNVYLRTFGCRANHADTEAMRALVVAAGAVIVASPSEADVAIFNSCTVTADAEADLRQAVRRASRARPAIASVVTGCAAARSAEAIRGLPSVVSVIPGIDLPALAGVLGIPAAPHSGAPQTGTRAFLRIQDGCDEHCTFCATTLARGAHRSRALDDVVTEASQLAPHHPEIVLTGIHIGSWGAEWGSTLGVLVDTLAERVPMARFRLSSVEATEVDPLLRARLRAGDGRVTPWLHAPLQSGSDAVLRRMGRHWYTAARYEAAIVGLVDGRPAFGLGADIMTGFPGETSADHRATVALVERLPFTALHVFPYSPRPGTAAGRLGGPVSPAVAAERAAELRTLASDKAAAYRARRAGTRADVIAIEGGTNGRTGMTDDYLMVDLADPTVPRGTRWRGTLVGHGARLTATMT